jgi:hypothetical protein
VTQSEFISGGTQNKDHTSLKWICGRGKHRMSKWKYGSDDITRANITPVVALPLTIPSGSK